MQSIREIENSFYRYIVICKTKIQFLKRFIFDFLPSLSNCGVQCYSKLVQSVREYKVLLNMQTYSLRNCRVKLFKYIKIFLLHGNTHILGEHGSNLMNLSYTSLNYLLPVQSYCVFATNYISISLQHNVVDLLNFNL